MCKRASSPPYLPTFYDGSIRGSTRDSVMRLRGGRYYGGLCLRWEFTTGYFRTELISLVGGLDLPEHLALPPAAPRQVATEAPPHITSAPQPPPLAQQTRNQHQDANQNPQPDPQLQVRPGFRIRRAINNTASKRVHIPVTDDERNFCIMFHLKWVCNRNVGSQNSHRALSRIKFGRLVGW